MDFYTVAAKEYRNWQVFADLAAAEKNEQYKELLEQLAGYEQAHFTLWSELTDKNGYRLRPSHRQFFKLLRKLLGLTFTVRLLEMLEGDIVEDVRQFLFDNEHPRRKEIEEVIYVEEPQEVKLIRQIKEERVEFIGSIVLGLNDGLIELSGALTGFSFAFQRSATVVLAGFILGVSASLSMASSAYLQARHERGKDPQKAALYTGVAYMVVVALLVGPFVLAGNVLLALPIMILIVVLIVALLAFYTSVLFSRSLWESFREMLVFSIGTAVVTFLIGVAARRLFGISL